MAQQVKNLSAMQEMRVHALGQEDPLEKEMAPHSSVFAWEIPQKRTLLIWNRTSGYGWRNKK